MGVFQLWRSWPHLTLCMRLAFLPTLAGIGVSEFIPIGLSSVHLAGVSERGSSSHARARLRSEALRLPDRDEGRDPRIAAVDRIWRTAPCKGPW